MYRLVRARHANRWSPGADRTGKRQPAELQVGKSYSAAPIRCDGAPFFQTGHEPQVERRWHGTPRGEGSGTVGDGEAVRLLPGPGAVSPIFATMRPSGLTAGCSSGLSTKSPHEVVAGCRRHRPWSPTGASRWLRARRSDTVKARC